MHTHKHTTINRTNKVEVVNQQLIEVKKKLIDYRATISLIGIQFKAKIYAFNIFIKVT